MSAQVSHMSNQKPQRRRARRLRPAIRTRPGMSKQMNCLTAPSLRKGRRELHHWPHPQSRARNGRERKRAQGDIFEFTMESKDSKIYPGIAREPNTFAVPEPSGPEQGDRQQLSCSLYAQGGGCTFPNNTYPALKPCHRRGGCA